MKIHIMTRSMTPAFVLTAWLLLPQTVQCFYNSSTGRWLSRAPIGESGHQALRQKPNKQVQPDDANLCDILHNDALNSWDALGLMGQPRPPRPPPRKPPVTDPVQSGQCRIQVCCAPVFDLFVFEHCYLRFDDEGGVSGCRGEHSRDGIGKGGSSGSTGQTPSACKKCCGYYGTIMTECGGPSGKVGDDINHSNQACTTVAEGAGACDLIACLRRKMNEFTSRCYKYRVFGPNSNTAVATALEDCLGSAPKPLGVQSPGYRHAQYDDDQCL